MPDNIISATIADITALTNGTRLSNTYYSTDILNQGIWNLAAPTTPYISEEIGATIILDIDGNIWKREIENNVYMPEWFNFLALGLDYTDPVNACIKVAKNNTVLFSGGKTYLVRSAIIRNTVTLTGTGTLKKFYDVNLPVSTSAVITISSTVSGSDIIPTKDVIIEDLTIDGNRAVFEVIDSFSATTLRGISATSNKKNINGIIERVKINNVTIVNTYNEAIRTECCNDIFITNSRIVNCQQKNTSSSAANSAIAIRNNLTTLTTDTITEFKNIMISGCTIDQTSSKNGCIRVSATGNNEDEDSNVLKNVMLLNNTCLLADYTPTGTDTLLINGVSCDTSANGAISDILISGNIINCVLPVSGNIKYHVQAINLSGESGTVITPINGLNGISGVIISNNTIKTCKRRSIIITGKNITVIGNEMYESGYIDINSVNVVGGMSGINITGNTVQGYAGDTGGFTQAIGSIYIQAKGQNLTDTIIEGNIFEGYVGTYASVDLITIETNTPVSGESSRIYNMSIVNNHFLNIVRHGINFVNNVYAENINVSGNIFDVKTFTGASPTPGYCILSNAKALKNISVTNNTFDCMVHAATETFPTVVRANGISIDTYTSGQVSDYDNFMLTNNQLYNTTNGLSITNVIDAIVITDNIFDTSTQALTISSDCINVILKENVLKNGGTVSIDIDVKYLNTIVIINNTGSSFGSSTLLNNAYPGAAIGQTVVCPAIDLIYEKTTATQWIKYPSTIVV